MIAYRKALSFRSSHYFVSYFSEVSSLLAGLEAGPVAKPSFIELPRSLVEVVIYWNMPMHHWLKTCKYHQFLCYISYFLEIGNLLLGKYNPLNCIAIIFVGTRVQLLERFSERLLGN